MNTVVIIIVSILGTLLFLVLAVLIAWWWIKRRFKRFVDSITDVVGEGSALTPPLAIELEPTDAPNWRDEAAVQQARTSFQDAGYQVAGVYTVDEIIGLTLVGLVNETDRTMAVVYDHMQAGIWCDITQVDESGAVYGVTSGPESGMAQAPWKSGSKHPGASADELLRHFKDGQPQTPRPPIACSEFKAGFEREYAREMQWQVERGGPTEAEIRRIAANSGQEVDDDMIEQVRETWQDNINGKLDADLRKAFLASNQVTAAEWDELQHRVFFIHDGVSDDHIVEHYMAARWDDDDDDDDQDGDEYDERIDAAKVQIKGLPARDAFVLLNNELPTERRARKLGDLTTPRPADVYAYASVKNEWD